MKSDINLIYKRKTKTYSSKKTLAVVLLIVLVAAGMYAGIALPSGARQVIKLEVAELDSKLNSSTQTQQQLTEKSAQEKLLLLQHTELKALDDLKREVSLYFDAIEKSLPTEANIAYITASKDIMSVYGIAVDDDVIATFCLRLREQNVFSDVFVTVSTYLQDDKINYFQLDAKMPSSLETEELIKQIEGKDDVTPAAEPTPKESN